MLPDRADGDRRGAGSASAHQQTSGEVQAAKTLDQGGMTRDQSDSSDRPCLGVRTSSSLSHRGVAAAWMAEEGDHPQPNRGNALFRSHEIAPLPKGRQVISL